MYIYTYICMYIYVYIHIYICIHTYMYCMCVYIYISAYVYEYVCHICIDTYFVCIQLPRFAFIGRPGAIWWAHMLLMCESMCARACVRVSLCVWVHVRMLTHVESCRAITHEQSSGVTCTHSYVYWVGCNVCIGVGVWGADATVEQSDKNATHACIDTISAKFQRGGRKAVE